VCYTIGAILFSRFTLDEKAYQVIRTELDARRAENENGKPATTGL
jgi:Na+/melibiose symporter-like transporter